MSNELIIVKQLPQIEEHLKERSEQIEEKVKNAKSLVCTEESVKAIKEVRAELNKEFKEVETQRKMVKEQILAPYTKFEEIYKTYISDKYKSADIDLKNKIDTVENELKNKKEQEIKDYFEEYKKANDIDFITYEQAKINVTLSASKKSLKEQVKTFIDHIESDLNTLETLEQRNEMLVEYKQNGYNLNNAVSTVKNRIAMLEREKEIQEKQNEEAQRIRKNIEHLIQANAPLEQPTTTEEKEYVVNFKVVATKEKLVALKKFLNDGGYKYE